MNYFAKEKYFGGRYYGSYQPNLLVFIKLMIKTSPAKGAHTSKLGVRLREKCSFK